MDFHNKKNKKSSTLPHLNYYKQSSGKHMIGNFTMQKVLAIMAKAAINEKSWMHNTCQLHGATPFQYEMLST